MPRLNFKPVFREMIRGGGKTTTLRRWRRPAFSAGQVIYSAGVGWLKITDCEQIALENLGRADAESDGFSSIAELMAAISRLYPDHQNDGKQWYRVRFERCAKPSRGGSGGEKSMSPEARSRLAEVIRAELDKAVPRRGSLLDL